MFITLCRYHWETDANSSLYTIPYLKFSFMLFEQNLINLKFSLLSTAHCI